MLKFISLFVSMALFTATAAHAEKIRYICGGTHVEYDGWGKRVEQMSSLKEDPIELVVDTDVRKVTFSTLYGGLVVADLKESAQWYEGEFEINKTVMNRQLAFVSVKVGRIVWAASTIYTLDNRDGENYLGYAGVCTPKVLP